MKTAAPHVLAVILVISVSAVLAGAGGWPFDAKEAASRQEKAAKELQVPRELTLDLDKNVTMRLVLIPAGRFVTEPQAEGAKPKDVTIAKSFYMAVHETTQEQYKTVMDKNPSLFEGKTRPVEQVSWDEATEFCRKLSAVTKKAARLPTQAEWEWACRAGTATPFHVGDVLRFDQANFDESLSNGDPAAYRKQTVPVGSFKSNAWGLFDMHGNVAEWTADSYELNGKMFKIIKGGCWASPSRMCRSGYRNWLAPDYKAENVGFRVVVDVVEQDRR